MTVRRLFVGAALGLGLLAVACGGAARTDLFGSQGGEAGAPAASGTTSAGGSDAAPGATEGGATVANDGGVAGDAGSSPSDATTSPEASPPLGTAQIACGPFTCAGGEACCSTGLGTSAPKYSCLSSGQTCTGGLLFPCDDAADCGAGNVCCFRAGSAAGYEVACRATGDCKPSQSTGQAQTWVCDPKVTGACPPGTKCGPLKAIPGFNFCQ